MFVSISHKHGKAWVRGYGLTIILHHCVIHTGGGVILVIESIDITYCVTQYKIHHSHVPVVDGVVVDSMGHFSVSNQISV